VALAEKSFPCGVGGRVNLPADGLFEEFVLFGENPSRIVISCDANNVARIKELSRKHGVTADVIGETIPGRLEIAIDGAVVVSSSLEELNEGYESALKAALQADPEPL